MSLSNKNRVPHVELPGTEKALRAISRRYDKRKFGNLKTAWTSLSNRTFLNTDFTQRQSTNLKHRFDDLQKWSGMSRIPVAVLFSAYLKPESRHIVPQGWCRAYFQPILKLYIVPLGNPWWFQIQRNIELYIQRHKCQNVLLATRGSFFFVLLQSFACFIEPI